MSVKNFRAVREADIQIKGITVVAGINSTGKSTLSRLLYHVVQQALEFEENRERELAEYLKRLSSYLLNLAIDLGFDIEGKIKQMLLSYREYDFDQNIKVIIQTVNELVDEFEDGLQNRLKIKNFSKAELNRIYSVLNIKGHFESETPDDAPFGIPGIISELKKTINKVVNKTKEQINNRPLDVFFYDLDRILRSQISYLDFAEDNIHMLDRERNRVNNIYTIENVFYIDTPFALQISASDYISRSDVGYSHWSHLRNSIIRAEPLQLDNIPESVYSDITGVIEGYAIIEHNNLGEQMLFRRSTDGLIIELADSATGIKSFAILQMLLSHGLLNDKTLLILDEPEAHLHPQWIVEYARVLVLLNKRLGVRFMLASHNPDMVSALRYISEKEETLDDLNFYLSEEVENQQYIFRDLGVDIEPIFDSFNVAFDKISRYGV